MKPMSKAKILVADHDPKFSRLLAAILNHAEGYEAREENRPFSVIETARAFRPRLIVLNANMDGNDGRQLASAIRSDPILGKTPIIFVTEPDSGNDRGKSRGLLSMSRYATPRHYLNLVRAACPRVDQGRTVVLPRVASFGARDGHSHMATSATATAMAA
jgi:DNA-binding response OmpR family regulator